MESTCICMCVKLNHFARIEFFFFFKKEEVCGRLEVWGDGRRFELGIAENKRGIDENKLGMFGPC